MEKKNVEESENFREGCIRELEIVQCVAKRWYVLWYTKVKDISHLYISMYI